MIYENCHIQHDGTHFIAYLPQLCIPRMKFRRKKTEKERAFRGLYQASFREGIDNEKERREWIREILADTFGEGEDLDAFLNAEFEREERNLYVRKRRFFRKAFLNEWNYFVTFTYDNAKHDGESFKRKLRRTLANLHTRRGWKYMGMFEVSPEKKRIHFHGVFYIAAGEMVGELVEVADYSTEKGKRQTRFENSFFRERYGVNQFVEMERQEMNICLNYIVKYIAKTGDRIVYSRAIPTELRESVSTDQICAEYFDFIKKFVLFDDWQNRDFVASPDVLEGDDAIEWLICFTGYEKKI